MSENTNTKKLSNISLFLIYSGAAISIAEIVTGAILAPLGFLKGVSAIITGHLIGGILLYLAAVMGSVMKKPAMECTRFSFGIFGSYLFSACNILQLVGWTAIMMIQGSAVFDQISLMVYGYSNPVLWMIIIASGICVWLILLSRHFSIINSTVVLLLLTLCITIGYRLFHTYAFSSVGAGEQTLTFWQGVELNIAMCLSWLPLIADYTQHARSKYAGPLGSVIGYTVVGSGMFTLGLALALSTNVADLAGMLVLSGLTVGSLFIVLFSTVTTTYLDVYSACDSLVNIYPVKRKNLMSIFLCVFSLLLALFLPMEGIEPFLYGIGSVFAPLYAILFTDYFLLRSRSKEKRKWSVNNLCLWISGFILYHVMQNVVAGASSSILIFIIVSAGSIVLSRLSPEERS
ncbi:MAG: putative hydroxymethylpyrimidine transporter CytX [Sphaerochaetaceae bacterium]